MSFNPFAPPKSQITPAGDGQPPPREIRIACTLVLVSLVLGLATLLPGVRVVRPDDPDVPFLVSLAFVLFFGGLTLWLATKVWQRRNWARWGLVAYILLGWWLVGMDLQEIFLLSPVSGVIEMVCMAIEAGACWFLLVGRGPRWLTQRA